MSHFSLILRRGFSSPAYKLLYQEKDMSKLAENFKKTTQSSVFRRKPDYYELAFQQLSRAKAFGLIQELLDDQKKYVEISKEGFAVRLISLYAKSGFFDHAHQLFDEMPELKCVRTVKSFNALLRACVTCKKFDKIDGFFRELPDKLGIKRDVASYNSLIKGFCEMGSFDLAVSMLDEMEKEGVMPDVFTFNTLIDAFYKKRRFLDGEILWGMMGKYNVVPDIISYNVKLLGFVLEKKIPEAIEWVEEIKNAKLKLDKFTFNILFKGLCSDGKYLKEAKDWYIYMTRSHCEPDIATFATLLPFACANGDFQFGAQLCKKLFTSLFRLKNVTLVQNVIDGLVKQSDIEEAELLLRLGKDSKHSCYRCLKIPELESSV